MGQISQIWLIAVALGGPAGVDDAARPNIVLMMADDMGLGDTSAYQDFTRNDDRDQIATPNMERLARMGVRFTDAHTPSTRCSPTRYSLLTGRYAWRSRLKHWVLFGAQGDPMIEADRPTLATLVRDRGYRTAMVGKWHVGLRYRRSDGAPAAAWEDADLMQPLFDTPYDHGFDDCRFTSRSHGTSGAQAGHKRNNATQSIGPGHIHNHAAVSATGLGKQLQDTGPDAYVLTKLGSRHSDHAIDFLNEHLASAKSQGQPFFLYYACNSNHSPYTPDDQIGDEPVADAARSVAGTDMGVREDFVYENDVALGRLLDYLQRTDDPRRPDRKLLENTIVIFTSDNGAEVDRETATGPFRSNKGSVYEGGHRVPFLVTWQAGGVGDGDPSSPGATSDVLLGLQDVYATVAEILDVRLPDLASGAKGAEDSISVLDAWAGRSMPGRPMIFNDHKQAEDHAAAAIRLDDPTVDGREFSGQWKLLVDAALLRRGDANAIELYDLSVDPQEQENLIDDEDLEPLVSFLAAQIQKHRTIGGHRLAAVAADQRIVFDWQSDGQFPAQDDGICRVMLRDQFFDQSALERTVVVAADGFPDVRLRISGARGDQLLEDQKFRTNNRGLGLSGGEFEQVDDRQALLIHFDRDVIVESAAIVAGNGQCGGFYQIGDDCPLQIYCVDADVDAQDQSGLLSDIGVLKAGQILRLDSSPYLGVEDAGRWRLGALTIRLMNP